MNEGNPCPKKLLPPVVNGQQLPAFINSSEKIDLDMKYLPNIDIFTKFGDLTPGQILIIFNAFLNWPEYKDSVFVNLMQDHYMKVTTTNKDSLFESKVAKRI